jgi:hypothetical protein
MYLTQEVGASGRRRLRRSFKLIIDGDILSLVENEERSMAGEMAILALKYRCPRIAADIETIIAENLKIEARIDSLRARLDRNATSLEALNTELQAAEAAGALAFQVNLQGTAPRKTWPKNHQGSWGSITRQVLTQLRSAQGLPMTTHDIARQMAEAMSASGSEPELAKLRASVGYSLKRLAPGGTVRRVGRPFEYERFCWRTNRCESTLPQCGEVWCVFDPHRRSAKKSRARWADIANMSVRAISREPAERRKCCAIT